MTQSKALAAACIGMSLAASLVVAGELAPAPQSLLTFEGDTSAGMSAFVQGGSRDFVAGGSELLNVSVLRVAGRISADIWPFLALYGGAGWAEAEIDNLSGEGGLALEGGALLNILEYGVGSDAISLTAQKLNLAVDLNYSWWESNFGSTDMHWGELTATPQVAYTVTRSGNISVQNYEPRMAALRAGVTFTDVNGSYGAASLSSNRDFGGFVAGDVLLRNDWVVSLDAVIYGGDDRLARLLLGRYF